MWSASDEEIKMTFVAELEPTTLWSHFDGIMKIPRGSKNEEQIRAHVIGIAERNGFEYEVDHAGNVVVRKPATAGHEKAITTILQAHLDMVNEKNSDVDHDFDKDPIKPLREGDYLTADGTTLGSDNGIGVAAMLAVLEARDLVHGPLEFAFTIDEETGLTGASQLNGEMLRGRQLLNLDSEEEGYVYVGCAGGGESLVSYGVKSATVKPGAACLKVKVHGMKGGHSGCDIHLQRGNAIKVLARALLAGSAAGRIRLASFGGGNAHNAIPREANAVLLVAAGKAARVKKAIAAEFKVISNEFRPAEPGMAIDISTGEAPAQAWTPAMSLGLLQLVNGVPHGVEAMSYDIPGLVETSTNLATVKEKDGKIVLGLSSRSSVDTALEALRRRIRSIGELAGASVVEDVAYPGWKPDLESHVLQVVKEVHQQVLGFEPQVKAIHAGLECGIIGKKIPGIDMVSIGPQIEFPHSPDERVRIPSVGDFYRLLTAVLEKLA
jgi:dipeptidase D